MKDITQFANVVGTPTGVVTLDVAGSSQDRIFAEAVVANEPTSILEQAGIVTVRRVPVGVDECAFPVVRNTQFTWTEIDARTGSNALGSDLNASALSAVEYRKVRPTIKTANVFLPDEVSLVNGTNFDLYAKLGAIETSRKKEADTMVVLTTEANHTNLYNAGGIFMSNGSITAGSTLMPYDLSKARTYLSTGSNINPPDFALMHPNQYNQLNTHSDFAPGATARGAMLRKARFNEDGDIVRFDGMDIFTSELMPAVTGSATTAYPAGVNGHPVIIGARGKAVARGETIGVRVSTEDSRRLHGKWLIFDVSYASDVLVKEALLLFRAAD